jgi:hypothetical protein
MFSPATLRSAAESRFSGRGGVSASEAGPASQIGNLGRLIDSSQEPYFFCLIFHIFLHNPLFLFSVTLLYSMGYGNIIIFY